ncbi:MAG: CRISPR-associated endonuclease Cas2 [Calditrichaeota bacterium]|nr:CRISPR-associated endonuclease Cas2 [Calditrichota bacterium]HQU73025.1 CRISPR-associated endonuclease Cas2 [Calditrichia bacterium]
MAFPLIMYLLICYDISKNRTRNKISKKLLDEGLERVQKSVFEGSLPQKQLGALRKQLNRLLGKKDSIRYYQLCKSCQERVLKLNPGIATPKKRSKKIATKIL